MGGRGQRWLRVFILYIFEVGLTKITGWAMSGGYFVMLFYLLSLLPLTLESFGKQDHNLS